MLHNEEGTPPQQPSNAIPTPIQVTGAIISAVAAFATSFLVHSLNTQIISVTVVVVLLLLGQFFAYLSLFPKISRGDLLVRIVRIGCITWIVTVVLVLGSRMLGFEIGGHENPSEKALINLNDKLSALRSRYQRLLHSSREAPEVAKDAAQLAAKIEGINDADLLLDMQIFKYQSLAYSWGMVAGSEVIATDDFDGEAKLQSVGKLLDAAENAQKRIDEAYRVQPGDTKLQPTRDWIVQDDAKNRIQRLKGVGLCFRWQLNRALQDRTQQDCTQQDRVQAKNLIKGLTPDYKVREHPEKSYELAPCLNDK